MTNAADAKDTKPTIYAWDTNVAITVSANILDL